MIYPRTTQYREGKGPSTPWGRGQYVKALTRGVAEIGTAGHGGLRVSKPLARKRLAAVLHCAIERSDYYWFEEDCAYFLVVLCMPEIFDASVREQAPYNCKSYYPDEYTRVTGEPVSLEESYVLRKRAFEAETRERFVVRSACGIWKDGVSTGVVEVHARRASDGAEKTALVSEEDYSTRGHFGYVLPD